MKKLFVCYLGGKLAANRMGEDHEVIVVVAEDLAEAKKSAKEKWMGEKKDVHVDHIIELEVVDGYQIKLEKRDDMVDKNAISHHSQYSLL